MQYLFTKCVCFCFLLFFSTTANLRTQNKQFRFEHILVRDGLPAVSVTSLYQDKFGFIWIGTSGGIVKYDGYQLERFKINKNNLFDDEVYSIKEDRKGQLWIAASSGLKKFDSARETFIPYDFAGSNLKSSLKIIFFHFDRNNNLWFINGTSGNWYRYDVTEYELSDLGPSGNNLQKNNSFLSQSRQSELGKLAFLEDNNGNIWIGIDKNGVYKYIHQKDSLINFKNDPKEFTSLGSNSILKIIQDSQGSIWIGTDGGGLNLYDYQNNSFKRLQHVNNNPNSLINNTVQSIYADKKGFLWLTTPAGLDRLDPQQNEFIHFSKNSGGNNHISTNWAMPLCEDALGNMWVINEDDVPEYFDYEKFSFTNCLSHPIIPGKYNPSAGFSCFIKDHSGNLWFGTWGGGINKIDPSKVVINNWEFLSDNGKIIGGSICSICEDANGNLAVRTYGGNLLILNSSREKISTFITGLQEFPYNGLPVSIFDRDGNLWLGAIGPKVIKFDMGTERFKEYRIQSSKDFKPNSQNRVLCIIDETDDKLLIGTLEGIVEFNKKSGVNHLYQIKNNISDDYELMTGFKDATKRIWLSTKNKGLYQYLPDKKEFIKPLDVNVEVLKFYEDRNQNIWLGTLTSGVLLMDKSSGVKQSYSRAEGLPTNQASDMAEDDEGNIWVLTFNATSKINPKNKSIKNYGVVDGFSVYGYYCICKSTAGEFFLGNQFGLMSFFPNQIKDNPIPPKALITNISLFNRADDSLKFNKSISDLREVELGYDNNDLEFEFVGLHYVNPKQNIYSFKLENFDDEWTDPSTARSATYTNLDPGDYNFRVRAANSDGIWNEEGASIKIIILPPWYQTTWAYLFYILFIAGIIYSIWKAQLKRIKIKNDYEMSRFEAQKMHDVDKIKTRFFTNISHEFRTPLTLILGPIEQAIGKIDDEKTKDVLSIAHKNANKLLGLVNHLLDIAKLESGNMKLRTSPVNFISLLKALTLSFSSYAERKRITLKFNSTEDEVIVYVDKDKIERIITNILSNALKFTPEGGRIEVNFIKDDKYVNTIISDTGIGIPKAKLSKIFNRFYQVDGSHTREQEGTGIGLALTKELVDLHKGKIEVETVESRGTTFRVSIPLGIEHLKTEEIFENDLEYQKEVIKVERYETIEKNVNQKMDVKFIENGSSPLLLIVEDNYDVRNYIKDNLMKEFITLEAVDGEDGWDKSIENLPDLIISDVMMPKMDGFKLCEKLKTDERTSHIPVILLTAKAAKEDKLEGYETGADDYIMKPFEPDELRARIKNLIEQRKRLHEHFQNKGIIELNQTKITSVDKTFLKKALDLINQNISDASFNVETLAENIAISRSVLYKKIVSLTGEPPVEFLRRIRLSKSLELIDRRFGNISEIALEVGFNNPSYFSECFKKQFGITPTQYQQKITKI